MNTRKSIFAILLVIAALPALVLTASAQRTIDLATTPADLTVIGATGDVEGVSDGDQLGYAATTGDVNGDGVADLIVGAPHADTAGGVNAGQVYVIYGRSELPSEIDLATTDTDFVVAGPEGGELAGFSVAAGDINGDGVDDLIVGAPLADPAGRHLAGKVYVTFGGQDVPAIDLTLSGAAASDTLGTTVATGDVNGDGVADLILGAPGSEPITGHTYIFYGRSDWPATIDLAATPADLAISATAAYDEFAKSITVGDVNGDGIDDLIIGAPNAWPGGQLYVIYGGEALPATIDLASTAADVTVISREDQRNLGQSSATGDIDGDGVADLIVGALQFDETTTDTEVGYTHVIYGGSELPSTLDLATMPADLTLIGKTFDSPGLRWTVGAGDINADGVDDLISGGPGASSSTGAIYAGETYVVFGGSELPDTLDLNETQADLTVIGQGQYDYAGWAVAAGDINADGIDDLVIGARRASTEERIEMGRTYVIFGGTPAAETATPTATASPSATLTPTVVATTTATATLTSTVTLTPTPTPTTTSTATSTPATPTATYTPTPTPVWVTISVHAEGYIRLDHPNGPGVPNVEVDLFVGGQQLTSSVTRRDGSYSMDGTWTMPLPHDETFHVIPASELYTFDPFAYSRECYSCSGDFALGGTFVAHPKRPFFLPLVLRNRGGVQAQTERAGVTQVVSRTEPAVPLRPAQGSAFGTRIGVPAIDVGNGWQTTLHVQNAGLYRTRAVAELYPAPDATGALGDSAPIAVLCIDSFRPGELQAWTSDDFPSEAHSAVVYSVVSRGEDAGCPEAGDVLRQPGQPLAVVVDRVRLNGGGSSPVAGAYTGVYQWGTYEAERGGYTYYAPQVTAGDEGEATMLIVQNMGAATTPVTVTYRSQAGDLAPATQAVPALAPGAAIRLAPNDVVSTPFAGAAWIQSDQPLAVVVDQWADDGARLMTYTARPAPAGGATYHAPLVVGDHNLSMVNPGWDTDVGVQNASTVSTATARISLQRPSGEEMATLTELLPPGGSRTIPLRDDERLPARYQGAARIENVLPVVNLLNDPIGQGASYNPTMQGGEVVALPWITKGTPAHSVIAVQNLNPNPGETEFRLVIYDAKGVLDYQDIRLGVGEVWTTNLVEWRYINPGAVFAARVETTSSTQAGDPALAAVVAQLYYADDRGDMSRAYSGVAIPKGAVQSWSVYLPLVSHGYPAFRAELHTDQATYEPQDPVHLTLRVINTNPFTHTMPLQGLGYDVWVEDQADEVVWRMPCAQPDEVWELTLGPGEIQDFAGECLTWGRGSGDDPSRGTYSLHGQLLPAPGAGAGPIATQPAIILIQ